MAQLDAEKTRNADEFAAVDLPAYLLARHARKRGKLKR
jgi:hypothetical protein